MKATDFVKKHGIKAVIHDFGHYLKDANIGTIKGLTHENEYFEVDVDDLKRLVESHEILGLFKSLDQAKADVAACEYAGHADLLVKLDCGIGYINTARVKQAIADVEACKES